MALKEVARNPWVWLVSTIALAVGGGAGTTLSAGVDPTAYAEDKIKLEGRMSTLEAHVNRLPAIEAKLDHLIANSK